jgi:hypothetical protein
VEKEYAMAYKCTQCGAEFSSREALRKHQFGHIDGDSDAARSDQPDVPLEDLPGDTGKEDKED